jgi:hypothetical protein
MQLEGWIFMILTWTLIVGLFVFSVYRTMTSGNANDGSDENGKADHD